MTTLLRFENIKYYLGTSNREIVVSAALESGTTLAIQGPSGSGKSTLLRILARLQTSEGGDVFYQNNSWKSISPLSWRSKVHYVAQKPVIFEGTVLDNLQKPFELANVKKNKSFDLDMAHSCLNKLLLPEHLLEQDARTLSGGEAARMSLLRSILFSPNILLLDEPTAALDKNSDSAVQFFLQEWLHSAPNRGLVLVSHDHRIIEFLNANILNITAISEGKTNE